MESDQTQAMPAVDDEVTPSESGTAAAPEPSWWHRGHPVFSSLAGFFTGMLFIILVPGVYGAVLSAVFSYDTAESLFPYVLVALAIPIALLAVPSTRRFGRYMVLGIVSTLLVVGLVAGAVLWFLINRQQ